MADRVGVSGTGVMGGAMARRLIACGFDVAVFDVNFQAMSPLADLGAVLESGPRAIADCSDIIVCSLPSAEISIGVAEAVAGTERLRVYMETSTIGRGAITRISELLAPSGIMTVDAPVSGGSFSLSAGKITAFVTAPGPANTRTKP